MVFVDDFFPLKEMFFVVDLVLDEIFVGERKKQDPNKIASWNQKMLDLI